MRGFGGIGVSVELLNGLLLNAGLLSICALLVTFLAAFHSAAVFDRADFKCQVSVNYFSSCAGIVFGLTSGLLIMASVRLETGAILDLRAAPLILSGIIGGPIAAVIAAIIGGIARLSVGGGFVWGGVLSMFIYAFAGYFIGRSFGVDLRKASFSTLKRLALTAVLATVCSIPGFFIDNDLGTSIQTMSFVFPMILVQNPLGLLLLGGALMLALRIIDDQEKLRLMTRELESSNKQLSAENRRLLDFSAIAAHDLKAPAVRIVSLTDFLREDLNEMDVNLPETVQEEIDFIADSAKTINRLINDLADYSLSQNNEAEAVEFETIPRLRTVVQGMSLPAGFEVQIANDLPMLKIPPQAFDIVMRNLIANCVAHHDRPSGKICISAYVENETATIEVTDDGPGVPEKYLDRIFRPMERLSPEASEGTGLGLSFVCGLTTAWSGTTHAFSAGSRGLTVAITAPVGSAVLMPYPNAPEAARKPEFLCNTIPV